MAGAGCSWLWISEVIAYKQINACVGSAEIPRRGPGIGCRGDYANLSALSKARTGAPKLKQICNYRFFLHSEHRDAGEVTERDPQEGIGRTKTQKPAKEVPSLASTFESV